MDSSGFRSSSEFTAQIDFIKSIAKRLDVSPNRTRAGVILYGSQPQLSIGLDNYETIPEFYALLDGLSRQDGGRQLHKVTFLFLELETTLQSKYVISFQNTTEMRFRELQVSWRSEIFFHLF